MELIAVLLMCAMAAVSIYVVVALPWKSPRPRREPEDPNGPIVRKRQDRSSWAINC
jgi:hypothetical protein